MNSLSYLSRQFDAVVASSSRSKSSTYLSRSRPSQSAPPSPGSSSALSVLYSRTTSPRVKRTKSSSSLLSPPQPPTFPQPPTPFSTASTTPSFTSSMNHSSPLIRPKSSPHFITRLVFVRLLLIGWAQLRAVWRSLSVRGQHVVPDPETEPDSEEVEVVQVDDVDEKDEYDVVREKQTSVILMQHPHRKQVQSPISSFPQPSSHLPPSSLLLVPSLATQDRTKTPTPPPIPQRPTPFHLPKTLVLDLDETLIHSTSRPMHHHSHSSSNLLGLWAFRKDTSHTVEVVLGGRSTTYHVYKRPFVDYFLRKVSSVCILTGCKFSLFLSLQRCLHGIHL
jgi:CTD nuclear envelope phosphatase 1